MGYDYIFRVGADASAIAKEVTSQMQNAQSIISGTDLIIKITGDPKSAQNFLNQIKSLKPEATVTLQADKKSAENLLKGLTGKIPFKEDKSVFQNAINEMVNFANTKLKDVNLTSFFADISKGLTDPTISAQKLFDTIKEMQGSLISLATLSNKTSLPFLKENQLEKVISLAKEQAEQVDQYNAAVKEARKYGDQYSIGKDAISDMVKEKDNGRGVYAKKAIAEQMQQIGISNEAFSSATKGNQQLVSEYIKTSALLDEMITKRKEFGEVSSKKEADAYVKQSQEILDVYNRVSSLQNQVVSAFNLQGNASSLLLSNPKFDKNKIQSDVNNSIDQYVKFATSTRETAVRQSTKKIEEYLSRNASKQSERSSAAAEQTIARAGQNINKVTKKNGSGTSGGGSGVGDGSSGGEGPGEGAADGFREAAAAAENLENAGRNAGASISEGIGEASEAVQELNAKISEAESKLEELQSGIKTKNLSSSDFKKHIQNAIDYAEKLTDEGADDKQLAKAQQRVLDLIGTARELGKMPKLSDDYNELIEEYGDWNPEYEYKPLSKIVDEDAIQSQIESIRKLREEKEALVSESRSSRVETGGGTSASTEEGGAGGTQGGKSGNASQRELTIVVNNEQALNGIANVRTQLETLPDTKEININVKDNGFSEKLSESFSKKNDIGNILQGWHDADTIKDDLDIPLQERIAAYNSSTGYITNSHLFDAADTVSTELLERVVQDAKDKADTLIHTHPTNVAAPSPEDFSTAITALKDGFTKSVVMGLNETTVMDLSGVSKDSLLQIEELFKQKVNTISDNYKENLKKTGAYSAITVSALENSDEYQNDIKKALLDSFKEVKVDPADIIKVQSTDDFVSNIKGIINSQNDQSFEINISSDVNGLRGEIESVLTPPFNIIVKPSESLRDDIQNVLKGSFSVDLKAGNISKDASTDNTIKGQSVSKIISEMVKADAFMSQKFKGDDEKLGPLKERAMYFNTETGYHTNPYIFDRKSAISGNKILESIDSSLVNAGMHSHPKKRAWMSINNKKKDSNLLTGDLISFLEEYGKYGIGTQIIAAQDEAQIFDVQSFVKDHGNLFGKFNSKGEFTFDSGKTQDFLSRYTAAKEIAKKAFTSDYKNLLEIYDMLDDSTLGFDQLFQNADKLKGDHPSAKDLKSALGNNADLSSKFWDYLKQRKNTSGDSKESISQVLGQFLMSEISNAANNGKLNLEGYNPAKLITDMVKGTDKGNKITNIFDDLMRGDLGVYLSRMLSDQAFQKMGVNDFLKKYNKIMPIDEFEHFYDTANEKTGYNPAANVDEKAKKKKETSNESPDSSASGQPDNERTQQLREESAAASAAADANRELGKARKEADGQTKSDKPEKTTAELYDENKSLFGKKAGNIDQLKEQFNILKLINQSIEQWDTTNHGAVFAPLKGSREELQKYKDEILELNPQLQQVADRTTSIRPTEFKQMFGSLFPSFEKLEESYERIGALQEKINNAGPNVTDSQKSGWVADLEREKQAFIEMYDAYNKMSNGAMDADIPGRKNITDMREYYTALRAEMKAVNEEAERSKNQSPISSGSTPTTVQNVDALKEKIQDLNTQFLQSQDAMMKSSQGQRFNFYDEQLNILMKLLPLVEEYNSQVGAGASKNLGLDVKDILKNIDTLSGSKNASGVATSELGKFIRNAKAIYPDFDYSANIDLLEQLHSKTISASDAFKELVNRQKELRQPNETPDLSIDDQTKQAEEAARKRAELMEKAKNAYQETFADIKPAEVDGSFDKMGASLAEAYENAQKLADAKREMNSVPDTDDGTENAQKAADAAREQAEFMEKAAQAYREAFASMDKPVEQNGEGGADFASGYIESLEKLQQKITEVAESVSILDDFFRQLGSSGDTFDGLHKNLTDVGESLTALDSFFREFGETTSGIGAAKEMGEAVQNISIGKNSVENIINLSSAIEMLGESFGKLSSDKFNNEALTSINNLLEKGEELKNLAKVLEANQNKIREAGKAADTGTAPKESDSEKAAREANEEYNKLIQKFEEAGKAKTKLNQILTKEVAGKTVDAQKEEAVTESKKADKEAEESLARINEMRKQGVISLEQLQQAEDKYNKSIKASAKSEDDLLAARQKKEEDSKMKELKAKRDAYNKDLAEYEKLYNRSAIGEGLSAGGNARMVALGESLKTQYNDLAKSAENGSESVQNLVKDLKTVEQVSSDLGKSKGTEWLSKLNNQLDNMKKQSSWRPDSWAKGLAEFGDGIKQFQEAIDRGAGYKELKEMYDELQATQKGLMKDSNFLPMKDNWQSSFSNKVETWANKNKDAAKAFNDELNQIRESIKNVNNEADALQVEDQFNKMSAEAEKQGLAGKSLGDRFKDQFKNTMTSLATYYLSFQDFVRYGREAISMVTELDTALTEMRKVSDESLTNLQDYQIESFDIADRVGTTAVQIQQSTADWLRLGKDLPQASQMAEMSTKLLNVSEFTSVDDATQALVSATQAYTDVTASDIVDKLNLIGNNFAVSTDELAQGLQNAGAVLKTQGNDLDQTLALLTAGNLIGQDMSKASAGIRTISLRIAGTKEAKNELAD